MIMLLFSQSAFLFKSIVYLSTNSPKRSRIFQIKKNQGKGKNQQKKYTTGVNTVKKSFAISHRT